MKYKREYRGNFIDKDNVRNTGYVPDRILLVVTVVIFISLLLKEDKR
jgi:hypothetical protein